MIEKPLGSGKNWIVVEHPKNKDVLIKEAKKEHFGDIQDLKQRYYLGKILHILFPHNIPNIHSIFTKNKVKLIVQKIKLDEQSDAIRKQYQDKSITKLTRADLAFWRRIKSHSRYTGLKKDLEKIGLHMDIFPENFGFDDENNLFYIDSDIIDLCELQVSFSQLISNLKQYINKLQSDTKRKKAISYLKRLEELGLKTI